jgi:superfamily II DNA or RNA helicase
MRYFEKIAAGPVIVYKKPPAGIAPPGPPGMDLDAIYVGANKAKGDPKAEKLLEKYKATKKGLILVDPNPFKGRKRAMRADYKEYTPEQFKEIFKWQTERYVKNSRQHELTHYLRDKKGKRSYKNSNKFYPAKLVEETAAYGRAEGGKLKGFVLALKGYPPMQALKKFIKRAGLVEEYKASPKGLVYIAPTGSGKTKKILEATRGDKTVAITPASITKNLAKEEMKFFKKVTPRKSFTYAKLSRGHNLPEAKHLVLDESHAIRNPKTKTFQNIAMQRWKYDKALLATATPMYNEPYDIVSQVNLVANKKILPMNKSKFYKKYYTEVKTDPGIIGRMLGIKGAKERVLKDPAKMRALLDKHTYVVSKSSVKDLMPGKAEEVIKIPMSKEQQELYKYVSKKLPFYLKYKIRKNLPPTKAEAKELNAYLMGVRQISNTTRGFVKEANSSPKFEKMVADARAELAKGGKVLTYSNFRRSGVDALSERFKKFKVPHGMIVGGMSKKQKADEVTKYQKGVNKLLLYSGAGSEGLNLPKTTLVQIAEPYWNKSRTQQAAARGIRRGADPSRTVKVKKYVSVFPQETDIFGVTKKRTSVDEYLMSMSKRKNREIKQLLEAIKDV